MSQKKIRLTAVPRPDGPDLTKLALALLLLVEELGPDKTTELIGPKDDPTEAPDQGTAA